jgi:membrane-associated phospholipid phosphatase
MDLSILKSLNGYAYDHAWFGDLSKFLAKDGVLLVVAVMAVVFLAAGRYTSVAGRRGASAAGFAALLALGVGQIVSALVDRSRPFVDHPGQVHLLIAHAKDAGFPSDHATGSFAIAAALLLRHRSAGSVALAFATAIAVARVAVGAHYPTDVLAGAALGAAAAVVLFLPPLRWVTDRVADLVAAIYERALAIVMRRPAPAAR